MIKKLAVFILLQALFFAGVASADVHTAAKHVVMLQSGLDVVWGTYMFGIRNEGESNAVFHAPIMLPREMVDFQVQDGITPEDVKTDAGGGFFVEKEFPPGLTLIAIAFKAKASFGSAELTFYPKQDLLEFSAMSKKGDLELSSSQLASSKKGGEMMGSADKYNVIMSQGTMKQGAMIKVDISGIPQGRSGIWMVGSLIGVLLIILATVFTFKTRKETAVVTS